MTRRNRSPIVACLVTLIAAGILFPSLLGAQTNEPAEPTEPTQKDERAPEKRQPTAKPWLDFSFDYEPEELYRNWREYIQWRRIWGPVGIGEYHIFPARQTGPNYGPPLTIWGHGIGTSLWRDPVTGHPLM